MNRKHINISYIVFLIIFLSGSFITLDFSRFFIIKEDYVYRHYLYIKLSKFLIIILSTLIVFLIGKDGLNKKDTNRLQLIFIFIMLSDISLGMRDTAYLGIILFAVVQTLLILRNGSGTLKKLKVLNQSPFKSTIFINTVLTTILLILIVLKILYPLIDNYRLFYLMIFYGTLLCLSFWTAITNHIIGLFPKKNSLLISIGMMFFVLCDLSVGFSLILSRGTYWIIADSLTWIFYTPAVLLIALSGYDFDKIKDRRI